MDGLSKPRNTKQYLAYHKWYAYYRLRKHRTEYRGILLIYLNPVFVLVIKSRHYLYTGNGMYVYSG